MSDIKMYSNCMDIKFFVIDIDGTLTDGKIYMGNSGELFKGFDIKDGYGIKEILPKYGIIPVVITARESRILSNRCKELGITELHQGCREKLKKLQEVLYKYSGNEPCTFANVAYMGDDLLDIQCMVSVSEAGGISACPNNAVEEVLDKADFICNKCCGEGAVREFIDWLAGKLEGKNLETVRKLSEEAYRFIYDFLPCKVLDGRYELQNGVVANVMTYVTKPVQLTIYESHRKYIDVQYMVYGEELIVVEQTKNINENVISDYKEDKDLVLYQYDGGNIQAMKPGDVIIFYPHDAHRGAVSVKKPTKTRKIVVKVPLEN
ncbi:MAG: YhcH/YjgK/YiaL family protein [Lachnospiraceae bacterium]